MTALTTPVRDGAHVHPIRVPRAMMPSSEAVRADRDHREAIIDIGSNSVRLVVYSGARRAPSVIFNEKVMAGLGRSLTATGRIDDEALARGLRALERFGALAKAMGLDQIRCVATAAVRDAANGDAIIAGAEAMGLTVELLTGEQEAEAAGYGVIASIPDADGIVADLGGGSLELVRVCGGKIGQRISFPLGVLRLAAVREGIKDKAKAKIAVTDHIKKLLRGADWLQEAQGLPLYLVGGSWRSLAKIDIEDRHDPLPVLHYHQMPPKAANRILRLIDGMTPDDLKAIPGVSSVRIPTLPDAALLLATLTKFLGSRRLIVSSAGLREGLLYQQLPDDVRAQDPLLVAAKAEGSRLSRFPEHGRLLDKWIAPLFADDDAAAARLRMAACLLSEAGWAETPDFRASRGLEMALHGDWHGIDMEGRIVIGQALYSCFGGGTSLFEGAPAGVLTTKINRAIRWGLAMRLGQRMSGGVELPLHQSRLERDGNMIRLHLWDDAASLYGEAVQRRLKNLAAEFKCRFEMVRDA